ncbi:rCG35152, isoform CRA_a [Rattus norvegicus]|uniref:RCG35152, isoform CRA_a n=1 Tax=Rattus norvegicus TaxID=10116 RepID=A6HL86_RAT|nr:rCG35152, isoform CRA_a [Rattus norvegicus]
MASFSHQACRQERKNRVSLYCTTVASCSFSEMLSLYEPHGSVPKRNAERHHTSRQLIKSRFVHWLKQLADGDILQFGDI